MIIVITGPTAVGKTDLSLYLAKKLNGEIINADSTQIYKNLNIATNKIQDKQGIPHHLLDIKDIDEDYTVFDFQKDARVCINDIIKRGKTPILVGGTGLYIKAALYDYEFLNEKRNQYKNINTNELYQKLLQIDPNTNIHPNNRKRIVTALNYYQTTNKPYSEKPKSTKLLYDTLFIGLTTDRTLLYSKINKRVDQMIKDGLIKEAKQLYDSGIRTKAIMTPIGYKELFEYFDGKKNLEESIELIKQKSRNYAKKQYTWFNHQMHLTWFQTNYKDFTKTENIILNYIKNQIEQKQI